MKKTKDDSVGTMKAVLAALGSFVVVVSTTSLLVSRYSDADLLSHSRSSFTEAEKQTMFKRSGPPQEAIDAMARMKQFKSDPANAPITSPWAKPQP